MRVRVRRPFGRRRGQLVCKVSVVHLLTLDFLPGRCVYDSRLTQTPLPIRVVAVDTKGGSVSFGIFNGSWRGRRLRCRTRSRLCFGMGVRVSRKILPWRIRNLHIDTSRRRNNGRKDVINYQRPEMPLKHLHLLVGRPRILFVASFERALNIKSACCNHGRKTANEIKRFRELPKLSSMTSRE
jgi:hypothetical protein